MHHVSRISVQIVAGLFSYLEVHHVSRISVQIVAGLFSYLEVHHVSRISVKIVAGTVFILRGASSGVCTRSAESEFRLLPDCFNVKRYIQKSLQIGTLFCKQWPTTGSRQKLTSQSTQRVRVCQRGLPALPFPVCITILCHCWWEFVRVCQRSLPAPLFPVCITIHCHCWWKFVRVCQRGLPATLFPVCIMIYCHCWWVYEHVSEVSQHPFSPCVSRSIVTAGGSLYEYVSEVSQHSPSPCVSRSFVMGGGEGAVVRVCQRGLPALSFPVCIMIIAIAGWSLCEQCQRSLLQATECRLESNLFPLRTFRTNEMGRLPCRFGA